jgi:hypothetical protein
VLAWCRNCSLSNLIRIFITRGVTQGLPNCFCRVPLAWCLRLSIGSKWSTAWSRRVRKWQSQEGCCEKCWPWLTGISCIQFRLVWKKGKFTWVPPTPFGFSPAPFEFSYTPCLCFCSTCPGASLMCPCHRRRWSGHGRPPLLSCSGGAYCGGFCPGGHHGAGERRDSH